jgi:hypothetical protein
MLGFSSSAGPEARVEQRPQPGYECRHHQKKTEIHP